MSHFLTAMAAIGAYVLLNMALDWNTRRADTVAKAQEHRLNTPGCQATVRQRDMGGKWSETRCVKVARK